jgi:hypothetical protein
VADNFRKCSASPRAALRCGEHILSNFNPTIRIVQPINQPDRLAEGVLNSLTRPAHSKLSFSFTRSLILTIFTLGILPLLTMIRQLRGLIAQQEQQLWHLAEWMRLQNGDADAIELQKASQKIRFNTPLGLLSWLFVLIAICAIALRFTSQPFNVRDLFRFAYHIPNSPEAVIFNIAIAAAAMCNWAHLAWHEQNIQRYIRWFNRASQRQNVSEIVLFNSPFDMRPMWIIAGIILACSGALWGLPVMLAAGAHRRYTRTVSLQTRSEIAQRLRAILSQQRPAIEVPRAATFMRTCIRPNCRAVSPVIANFCPRCGTRMIRRMETVA